MSQCRLHFNLETAAKSLTSFAQKFKKQETSEAFRKIRKDISFSARLGTK